MIELCALASGSNGNCYYIGNRTDAVLIDAGISCKQILLRMEQRRLNPAKIKALFITHEHSDHARGARVLSKKLGIPVFMTPGTFHSLRPEDQPFSTQFISSEQMIPLGHFKIHPFSKNHDATEPCSFRVEYDDWHIGVFTDIGQACQSVISNLKKCHALFLETNYDEQMLWNGPYPYMLKKRVASDFGHLSNLQAYELLRDHSGPELLHVFLSHLSGENNTPQKAFQQFSTLTDRFNVHLTSRSDATEVFILQ